jgi:tRNA (guanine37-N1)-methyltransferase
MKIDILTLFPNMFDGFLTESIIKRAIENKKATIDIHNIRDYSKDKHKKVDDTPYGGGAGMVLMCQPIFDAVSELKKDKNTKVILMTPQGVVHNQKLAYNLRNNNHLIFICGHYEGIDERIKSVVDMEISIGDYVLTGGEIPTMVVVDSVVRLIDGVIDNESHENDSFNDNLLDYPAYTKPASYNGLEVPDVLLSGHHENIEKWRQTERIIRTLERRPDLIKQKKGFLINKDIKNKEIMFFEYSKINGLDITPKNDARRDDVISVNKMILVKPSFINKVVKMKIDKKMKNLYDKFNYLLTVEDEDNTARVLDEAVKYRSYLLNNYISFMGEKYRDLILKKLQIIINELNIRLRLFDEIKENELSGKSR